MKIKIKDLSRKFNMSESTIRMHLSKPELACFIKRENNEFNHPIMYFNLNKTSEKLLLQCKKGYKPKENENIQEYIDENIKLQKENMQMRKAFTDIKNIINVSHGNNVFIALKIKDKEEILKIIEDML